MIDRLLAFHVSLVESKYVRLRDGNAISRANQFAKHRLHCPLRLLALCGRGFRKRYIYKVVGPLGDFYFMTALEVGRESVIEAECFAELSQAFLLLFQLNIEEKR